MASHAAIETDATPEKLTIEEIEVRYPNEWIALHEVEGPDQDVATGVVFAHHPDRKTLYRLARAMPFDDGAIFWTGKIRSPRSWS